MRPGPQGVVKVGGSLLGWPDLPARLGGVLAGRAGHRLVLIVGGGPAADWVRELDRLHALGEERSHHLALRAMDLTAHALAAIFGPPGRPPLKVVDRVEALAAAWEAGRTPVMAPRRWLAADDHRPGALPHSWRVTSDAIAARVADRLGAGELLLLKSAPLPRGTDRDGAARLGLVDPEFPRAAARLRRVAYLNLRDPAAVPEELAAG